MSNEAGWIEHRDPSIRKAHYWLTAGSPPVFTTLCGRGGESTFMQFQGSTGADKCQYCLSILEKDKK